MNEQHISLDVSKAPNVTQVVRIGQGDKGGTTIVASIYDNGIAMSMAGMTAKFCMRTPGNGYVEDESVTVSGSTLTYVVDEEHCASTAGYTDECYFQILQGTTIIASTSRFAMHVLRSVSDGTEPSRAWTNGIEEWLEDASDELNGFVANANARVGATINAANAAVEQVCAEAQSTVADAEETLATAAERVDAAIEAVEDISELAVPEMSPDVRGGAKLDADGGLALRDGALGVGSLVQESDGTVRGSIASLTAKGHAEQDGTPSPDNPQEIRVVRGRNLLPNTATSQTINGVTFTVNTDGSVTCNGTASKSTVFTLAANFTLQAGTYVMSSGIATPSSANGHVYCKASNGTYYREYNGVMQLASETAFELFAIQLSANTYSDFAIYPQLEFGSTPQPYVPYGHVGMEAKKPCPITISTQNKYLKTDGSTGNANGWRISDYIAFAGSVVSISGVTNDSTTALCFYDKDMTFISGILYRNGFFAAPANAAYIRTSVLHSNSSTISIYGVTTTPIPLPSRGWVGSLPDGTADVLKLDGAGHVEWTLPTDKVTFDGTENVAWSIGGPGVQYMTANVALLLNCTKAQNVYSLLSTHFMGGEARSYVGKVKLSSGWVSMSFTASTFADVPAFKTWLGSNLPKLYYPLATPVTEQCGYIDMPSIAGDATVSIPELDALGVSYFVDDAVVEYGRQIYERVRDEYAERIEQLEAAVAEIVAGA